MLFLNILLDRHHDTEIIRLRAIAYGTEIPATLDFFASSLEHVSPSWHNLDELLDGVAELHHIGAPSQQS
jgi:hypothetical protein